MDLFIAKLFNPATQFFALCWIVVVIISITLHELAHGWTAYRLGDPTPMAMGRLTGNPLVHMGPFSLVALAIVGIAWGQMPIDSSRLRGRHAEALVAAAGPATNVLLALLAMVTCGLLIRFSLLPGDDELAKRIVLFLSVAGSANLWLAVFNLMPVPPLDGSHIVATYARFYARFVWEPGNQGFMILAFVFGFVIFDTLISSRLIVLSERLIALIAGI
ncbi:site-2 protease family protein [Mucisphaera calidilacus]|uniref:Peptidase family M50 n=1 Tax=Mucisphaera calidilacus TaxID=2527982 RepID=A0A518BWJ3_9BACT|nr:site-2 protease family protein [Mucisphaera calidilacus]QDU71352.1 Peptidase family M50 [Mucisphaera calidilacus]